MASIATPLVRAETGTRARPRSARRFDPFRVFAYIFLTAMAIIYVAPLVWMISKSLMTYVQATSASIIPTSLHPENYIQVLTDPDYNFLKYLLNTVALEVFSVVGQTIICVMAAYGFSRIKFPGRDVLFGLFLLTIFVPGTVTLVPKLIIVTNFSQTFAQLNPSFAWLDSWPAQVIPFLANTFSIFLMRQFFLQVPEDLWEAARLDGAGHLRYLTTILVPIARPAVVTSILFTFIGTWGALEWPLLVTSTDAWRPIGTAMYAFNTGEKPAQLHLLMAASLIAILPIMLIYSIAQKTFIEGIATSGLKG